MPLPAQAANRPLPLPARPVPVTPKPGAGPLVREEAKDEEEKQDEATQQAARKAPPWLVSMVVHMLLIIGMALVGVVYGPLGTVLSELFPTSVRYSGSSLTFNLAGIFGASLAPYIATFLATTYGLHTVGYYLSASAGLSILGLVLTRETKDERL